MIQTLLALGAGSVFFWEMQASADTSLKTGWNSENHDPTFENFCALSAFITLHNDIPLTALRRVYAVMTDEPWGPSHMTRLHTKISAVLSAQDEGNPRASLQDSRWKFDEGEAWFARHLLTVFYTGLYVNAERPTQQVIYDDALMFRPAAGILPRPFLDPVGFGAWSETPETKE